jgi:hypothetical protein
LEIPFETKDDLFDANFGRKLNSHLQKRPSKEHISNPLKEESLRKPPYSHVGHWKEFKDGMSSEPIEGEPSHLEAIPILSPSMPTLDVSFKPILDLDDPSYALSPKSHDDTRNPLRHPKHGSHEDNKNDQEEQQQLMEDINNSYAVISKESLDEAKTLRVESKPSLDPNGEHKSISLINITHLSLEDALNKINLRVTNPSEILDIHGELTLELKKEGDINEHGSYFMNTSSNPCSYEKSPELISLSTTTHKIFNPLKLPIHKNFKRVVVDVFVYHKYCKSCCVVGMNLEIGTQRLVLEEKPLHQQKMQFEGFPRTSFCPKQALLGDNLSFHLLL